MTKSARTLHRVVMMASAFIVTQTFNLSLTLAKPGRIRGFIRKVKGKVHAAKEGIKDGIETVDTGLDYKRHSEQFWNEAGPIDLIGRNFQQTLIICVVGLSATLLLFRWKRDKTNSVGFWMKNIGGYLIGVAAGFGFEFLRSSGRWDKECQGLLTGSFLLLAVAFLAHYGTWWKGLKAIRARQFKYWLKTFDLPPKEAPPPAAEAEAEASDEEAEGQEEADASDSSAMLICPHCGKETLAGAKYCMICAADLAAPLAAPTCPHCGEETLAGAKYCMICAKPLHA